jgi:hypothetical protein
MIGAGVINTHQKRLHLICDYIWPYFRLQILSQWTSSFSHSALRRQMSKEFVWVYRSVMVSIEIIRNNISQTKQTLRA